MASYGGRLISSRSLAKFLSRQLSLSSNSHPLICLKLPKLEEPRNFVLSSELRSLKDLQEVIKAEDSSVQSINAVNDEGVLFSKSTSLYDLLRMGFTLEMLDENLAKHSFVMEASSVVMPAEAEDVRDRIKTLAGSLEIVENKIAIQDNLHKKLGELQSEFIPLENKRLSLLRRSKLRTNAVVWGGLFTMGAQFGFLARLVWWDYSWDIMEPVTYFVTYGTAIIMYCYFVCVRSDYNFETARDRWNLRTFHKMARYHGLDVAKYNTIVEQKKEIEDNLRQLENIGALLSVKENSKPLEKF